MKSGKSNRESTPSDDRAERVQKWRSGVDLSFSWLHYGSERQRRQQIERQGTPASLVIQQFMMGDVFGQLASGRLHAMGFQIAPSLSDGPVSIPGDVFDGPPGDDWQSDKVSASGYAFERVTVLPPVVPTDEKDSALGIETSPASSAVPEDRSMYGLCKPVFEALRNEKPAYIELSPERLLSPFRERYAVVHGDVAKLTPAPGLRTLRTHLKRYRNELRQVSASTGDLPNNT